ncbi:MAE_28990/MAE_18760 family HEPN-like nuclease [Enterococcus sp. S86.2]|uniref:MAE_28990/MAE_18760 family HEPN-like nuclease n=1 Tax=Enterococcus sp. S86.2 TaxID=3031299 RepID=UPI0026F0BA88|nr:MAE_28990/MAE_18760 family HEPN-like nuclease [Enterococcus sp. S86.2]
MQDRNLYFEKKKELKFFIHSLTTLYEMNDNQTSPYTFFLAENIKKRQNYIFEDFLVILKSNSFIMIYNLVESTIKNSVIYMYDEINKHNIRYLDARDEIKRIWFNYHFKDNVSSVDKLKTVSQVLIDEIISEKDIFLDFEQFKLSGNADWRVIKKAMSEHGMIVNSDKTNPHASSMRTVKDKRNSLAHGSESFIDSAKDFSERDIQRIAQDTFTLLEYVMDEVDKYIEKEKYKI